ncbi:Holliday junction ATP-dependent DNA helicase RuvA [Caldovatus sediminis]|jgi:Holliday junction DNA helicase RuvA|uniref:Holliday junction branch migration complex subunit RuvA n=1 Tax=Caldovatus sediminis TaxID=2041189 RepID=A0A8J2ZAE9_9PROT|nr:Holliday junction branch migration protein RuvA [Caldovatus sediminis]GGG27733.1 Holliday junction ATP-dependent DNA helicase RuvA [Caldovatus sediminis]
MIGKLTGKLDGVVEGGCILDVGGVGYLVSCSQKTLGRLQSANGTVQVLVETHVRQDAIVLYGFATEEEREAFRNLIEVKTVGPQKALIVLSGLGVPDLARAIAAKDRKRIGDIKGIGATTANRIVDEPAMQKWATGRMRPDDGQGAVAVPGDGGPGAGVAADAVSALLNLGWKRPEAAAAVARVVGRLGDDAPLASVIRDSLKELSSR